MRTRHVILGIGLVVGCKAKGPDEIVADVILDTSASDIQVGLTVTDHGTHTHAAGKLEVAYYDGPQADLRKQPTCAGSTAVAATDYHGYGDDARVKVSLVGCPPGPARDARTARVSFTPTGESKSIDEWIPTVAMHVTAAYQKWEAAAKQTQHADACTGSAREAAIAARTAAKPVLDAALASASPAVQHGIAALLASELPCDHNLRVYAHTSFSPLDAAAALRGETDPWQPAFEGAAWPTNVDKVVADALAKRGGGWLDATVGTGDPDADHGPKVVVTLSVSPTKDTFTVGKSTFPRLALGLAVRVIVPPQLDETDQLGPVVFDVKGQEVNYTDGKRLDDSTIAPVTFGLMARQLGDKLDLTKIYGKTP